MTRRYVTRASVRFSDTVAADVQDHHLTVFENNDAKPTGLLDAQGNPIYSVPVRGKLGFDLRSVKP